LARDRVEWLPVAASLPVPKTLKYASDERLLVTVTGAGAGAAYRLQRYGEYNGSG
jgi:hypothetical protein